MSLNLDQAEALWTLGRLPREELPEVATAALVAGADSPSLRVLAGLTATELDRASDLFVQALQQLGRPPLVAGKSAQWAAVTQAQAIVSGAVPAADGASALWWLWRDTDDEELQAAVLEFLTERERWELAKPDARPEIEREIVELARAFIDRWTPGGE